MKNSITTFGLAVLVMVLTSFTSATDNVGGSRDIKSDDDSYVGGSRDIKSDDDSYVGGSRDIKSDDDSYVVASRSIKID